jgi:hypothetical protein
MTLVFLLRYSLSLDLYHPLPHQLQQALQAMDNSHVALVTVELKANEFAHYRCDRNIPLGISVSPTSQQRALSLYRRKRLILILYSWPV